MDVEEEDTEEEWAKVPEKLKVLLLETEKKKRSSLELVSE